MICSPCITDVHFTAAPLHHARQGLVGWLSFQIEGSIRVEAALRRTRAGRLVIAFPTHRSARGRRHYLVQPTSDMARRAIEAQVFRAIGFQETTS